MSGWILHARSFKHACSIWNRTRSRVLLIPAMAGKSNQVYLSERCEAVKFTKCELRKGFILWGAAGYEMRTLWSVNETFYICEEALCMYRRVCRCERHSTRMVMKAIKSGWWGAIVGCCFRNASNGSLAGTSNQVEVNECLEVWLCVCSVDAPRALSIEWNELRICMC